jgi:hypothetical protein
MKRYLLLSVIVLYVFGIQAQDSISDHYQTSQFDVAIFHKEYKSDFGKHVKRFTPSKHDIDTAEYALREDFRKSKKMNDSIYHDKKWRGLDLFKRQYFGCIDKKGNKYLYIVCLIEPMGDYTYKKGDWLKERWGIILDSNSVWTIEYDLNTNKLFGCGGGGVGP